MQAGACQVEGEGRVGSNNQIRFCGESSAANGWRQIAGEKINPTLSHSAQVLCLDRPVDCSVKLLQPLAQMSTARKIAMLLAVPCLALVYGWIVDPETGRHGIPCLWKTLFGVTCPGCGLTRAWAMLLRGRWLEAARMNWLIYPVVVIYSAHLVRALLQTTAQDCHALKGDIHA